MSYIVSTSILGIQTFVTRFDPSGRAKTGARRIHDARWRVAFAMAGGGARAPDRIISARVTLRGGYNKCRLQ